MENKNISYDTAVGIRWWRHKKVYKNQKKNAAVISY